MNKMYKLLCILSIIILPFIIQSCDISNSSYYDGGKADVQYDYAILRTINWEPNPNAQDLWYQNFKLTNNSNSLNAKANVLVYIRNGDMFWEPIPMIRLLHTANNVPYTIELWYSYNDRDILFEYRNSNPEGSVPPEYDYEVKIVVISELAKESIEHESINIENHDEVMRFIEQNNFQAEEIIIE